MGRIDFFSLTEELQCIHTHRVAMRPVMLSDAWPLFDATRHPLFNRHLLWPQPQDIAEMRLRIERIIDEAERGRMTALAVVARDTGEFISLFRLMPYVGEPLTIENGIWTQPRYWTGRYSLEITKLMIHLAFQYSAATRVVGQSVEANRSSCALMLAAGARLAGPVRRATEAGEMLDALEFEVTRAMWSEARRLPTAFSMPRLLHTDVPAADDSVFGALAPQERGIEPDQRVA